jgi:hypothetical protein
MPRPQRGSRRRLRRQLATAADVLLRPLGALAAAVVAAAIAAEQGTEASEGPCSQLRDRPPTSRLTVVVMGVAGGRLAAGGALMLASRAAVVVVDRQDDSAEEVCPHSPRHRPSDHFFIGLPVVGQALHAIQLHPTSSDHHPIV